MFSILANQSMVAFICLLGTHSKVYETFGGYRVNFVFAVCYQVRNGRDISSLQSFSTRFDIHSSNVELRSMSTQSDFSLTPKRFLSIIPSLSFLAIDTTTSAFPQLLNAKSTTIENAQFTSSTQSPFRYSLCYLSFCCTCPNFIEVAQIIFPSSAHTTSSATAKSKVEHLAMASRKPAT